MNHGCRYGTGGAYTAFRGGLQILKPSGNTKPQPDAVITLSLLHAFIWYLAFLSPIGIEARKLERGLTLQSVLNICILARIETMKEMPCIDVRYLENNAIYIHLYSYNIIHLG
jgi:hypothetical protein